MQQYAPWITALGRLLIAIIFVLDGLQQLYDPMGTMKFIAAAGLPIPPAAYIIGLLLQLGGSVFLLIGLQTRWAAGALFLFCLLTAAIFHSDFNNGYMVIEFLKNLAIAGGLLQIIVHGGGDLSADARLAKRLRAS